MVRVAIVGAGKAGGALLEMFQTNGVIKTVGITDKDRNAPALANAKEWGIFIAEDIKGLYTQGPDIVINVTGNPEVGRSIRETAPPKTEVIEGTAAKFIWEMVQRQNTAKEDMETLYKNGLVLTSSKTLKDVLSAILEKAMLLTETPAGSIALCDKDEMVMAAYSGLKSPIL